MLVTLMFYLWFENIFLKIKLFFSFFTEMSSEFEEKELDFKNQQKVLFPGTSQSRPRPGSGQEKRQGDYFDDLIN